MSPQECPSFVPDLAQITAILSHEVADAAEQYQPTEGRAIAFSCEDFRSSPLSGQTIRIYTVEERNSIVVSQCRRFFEAAKAGGDFLTRLDQTFTALVTTAFMLKEGQSVEIVADISSRYLSRLPATALPLPDASSERHSKESLQQASNISRFLNTNIIRTALAWVIDQGGICHIFQDLTDITAELLETASTLENSSSSTTERDTWFVVRAFLWTSWQRSFMIYFHAKFQIQQTGGFHHGFQPDLVMRGTFPAPGVSLQSFSDQVALACRSPYMCTWAFESMRTESPCMIPDFRLFHLRFAQLFDGQRARCKISSATPCDGGHSDDCQRFKGLKIQNQSMHDEGCKGHCHRLVWDEASYRSISGARAVSLESTDLGQQLLRYCPAGDKTMAISHVWSHGHGGRPEEGINRRLHDRFGRIARSFGCDSYWMDTTCIPDDHRLRREAIQTINTVFYKSALTLVCDRDLMTIDVSNIPTRNTELHESILAAVLVCDWNVRAWTFLESIKGRKNVRILCKSDATLSTSESIRHVYAEGRMEIGILCHLLSNFLPRAGDGFEWTRMDRALNLTDEIGQEISGTLLSHRPASRPGDDVVIWSLLLGDEKVVFDPVAFWRSRINTIIHTGFLVSSAPRCKDEGLSWAPASPYAASKPRMGRKAQRSYRAFDGFDTQVADIMKDGLFGQWFICDLDEEAQNSKSIRDPRVEREMRKIRRSFFIPTVRFLALLQPVGSSQGSWRKSQAMARYRGRVDGTLLVVVSSNKGDVLEWKGKDAYKWKWKGLYEWPRDVPLPSFKKDHLCIV